MPKAPTRKPYLKARAAEPSTWAALAGIFASITPFLPPQYQAIAAAAGAVVGAVGAMKGDPAGADPAGTP
jgi:uncharacterized protein (DUF2062 family)